MMRNQLFEMIRLAQLEDWVIIEHTYHKCGRCEDICDVYIKSCDNEVDETVYICKDCFCNSYDFDYCIPFSYFGESGYIQDTKNINFLYQKYETLNQGGRCYNCGDRVNYGVFTNVRYSNDILNPIEHVFFCKECFRSQNFITEELHVVTKKKGLTLFNESKQRK